MFPLCLSPQAHRCPLTNIAAERAEKYVKFYYKLNTSKNIRLDSLLVDSLTECMGSLAQTWAISGFPVLVFATATSQENLPTSITSSFKHQVIFQPPDEQARTEFLNSVLSGTALTPGVDISELACETAAFTASDLSSLQKVAARYSVSRAFRTL